MLGGETPPGWHRPWLLGHVAYLVFPLGPRGWHRPWLLGHVAYLVFPLGIRLLVNEKCNVIVNMIIARKLNYSSSLHGQPITITLSETKSDIGIETGT